MAVSTVTFTGGTIYDAGKHYVYWRANWDDDWTLDSDLQCSELVLSCAPTIPTATLVWRYGDVKQVEVPTFAAIAKKNNLSRVFIKIEVTSDTATPWKWYGILEITDDYMGGVRIETRPDGTVNVRTTGQQVFTCYGMAKLLADHELVTSVWGTDTPSDVDWQIEQALTFNKDGKQNRSVAQVNGAWVFAPLELSSDWWSTQKIIEYMLAHAIPLDQANGVAITWALDSSHVAPDWDRPVIEQEHNTTFSIIEQLCSRKKLMTWWVDVVEGDPDVVTVYVNSLLEKQLPLSLSWSSPLKANYSQLHVILDQDQRTRATLRDDRTQVYDQVVVFGARRRTVCTISEIDSSLDPTPGGTTYDNAAKFTTGYSDLTLAEKQRLNAEIRSSPQHEDSYALFRIPNDWTAKVTDGIGGDYSATQRDAFVNDDGSRHEVYIRELEIEPELPLLTSLNYSDDAISTGYPEASFPYEAGYGSGASLETTRAAGNQQMHMMVAFRKPETIGDEIEQWVLAEDIGATSDIESDDVEGQPEFSCSVRVSDNKRGIVVRVHGAPGQHAIASDTFVGNDADPPNTGYSYENGGMIATVAIVEDRRVKAVSPATPATHDAVRKLYIDAGDEYRQDYIVPDTVVGIDGDGSLLRSTGGYIPTPGINSDESKLKAIAEIAAAYYTVPRRTISIESFAPTQEVGLGDLIHEIGNFVVPTGSGHRLDINSPVTQITITLPDDGTPISQRIDTLAGELDPMQLAIQHFESAEMRGMSSDSATEPIGGLIRGKSIGEIINKKAT